MFEVVCWLEMFDVSGRRLHSLCLGLWGDCAITVQNSTVTLLLNVALLLSFWAGLEKKPVPCPTHIQLYHVMRCWKSYDVPAQEGNTSILEEGISERRSAGTDHLVPNPLAFLLLREQARVTDRPVRFWQARFDSWGVLATLQKAVYLPTPASSLLTVIPYGNTKIKHCCGPRLTCTPAPVMLLLP